MTDNEIKILCEIRDKYCHWGEVAVMDKAIDLLKSKDYSDISNQKGENMSVLIRGIGMPKEHNYVTITIWPSGTASYGLFDREENLCEFKPIKAIQVPPHNGDLIERDALTISTAVPLDGKPYQYVHIDNIKAAPAVIKAEEEK